jgi:putative ABC transport system permease protein
MHFKKHVGDSIQLQTPSGPQQFKIIGIVTEFSNPEGVFYLNREVYKRYWKDQLVTGFFVMSRPDSTPESIRASLDQTLGKELGLMATLNHELNGDARKIVDDSFTYTKAIEWSALLVGLFGLFNTLFVSVLDRKREFGILRAVGMNRSMLLLMILSESVLQGLLGGCAAISIAVLVCYFWVIGTLSSLMGWVLQFSIPWQAVFQTLFAGLLIGLLAGLLPAFKAVKTTIRESLEN